MAAERMVAIGLALSLSCNIRCGAVAWLVKAEFGLVQAGGGKHSDGTGNHTGLIRKNITEHILGQNHIELLRIS